MNKRKPRVFVASTFKGLKDERKALELVFNKYKDGIDYWGYESWVGSGAPDMKSSEKARESDYLILILGDRYGTRSIRNNKSITQNEYEEFLYSHSLEIAKDNNTIHAFEKDVDSIKPEEAEVPGPGRIDLRDFSQRVKNRHTIPPQFKNWRELQNLVYNILKTLPRYIEDKKYQKLSIKQFEFQILGSGKYREENIKSNWSNCPCNVMKIGACEYIKKLHYRPPEAEARHQRSEIQRPQNCVSELEDPKSSLNVW